MWRLNKDYDLVLKPYDTDGLGGFKPFEQLWVKMSFVAVPVLIDFIILSVLNYFSSTPFYPIGKFSDLILCSIVIVFLLIVPILSYYRIVKAQKVKLLDSIECKIRKYYDKIEEVLLEEDKDVDKKWMDQIKQYQEIELKVKSIPSLPFATYKRTYLFFIAIIAIIPCITQFISYGQSFLGVIISWMI